MNSLLNKGILLPENKKFAFTVFDDTDLSTLDNVVEVYALLRDLGFRTTKSTWTIKGKNTPKIGGTTCEDKDYLAWVLDLKKQGFEIGYHNATYHSSLREDTIRGIEEFKRMFGEYPRSMANHADCEEGIYWGNARLTGLNEKVYNCLTFNKRKNVFRGHVEGDKFFWGDICKEKIQYVRNFVFPEINTLKMCPFMPYYDPKRPYVNAWYASSSGGEINDFNRCIREANQDRLEEEGGVCIMYTHFGKGFQDGKTINPRFRSLMERLSKKNGWYVPVATVLDYLKSVQGSHIITDAERTQLERKWLSWKLRRGTN